MEAVMSEKVTQVKLRVGSGLPNVKKCGLMRELLAGKHKISINKLGN